MKDKPSKPDNVVKNSGLQQLTDQCIKCYLSQQGADVCSLHYLINHVTSQDDGVRQRLATAAKDLARQRCAVEEGFTGQPPYVKVEDSSWNNQG